MDPTTVDQVDLGHLLHLELLQLVKLDDSIFDFIEKSSLDGLWFWDLQNPEHEWMSESFWTTLGYDPSAKKHLASEWQDIINEDDLKLATENFQKHCADPSHPYDQLVRYRHKTGKTVWIRCRGMAIRDEDGTPVRMLGAHVDVTELKEQGEALAEQEKTQKLIFQKQARILRELENIANIGTWEIDLQEQVVTWSLQTKRIHEVPDDYLPDLESALSFYKEGESQQAITEAVQTGIKDGTPWDLELELLTAKGRQIWVRALGRPEMAKGVCVRLFGVFQDITHAKSLKMQLEERNELMRVTLHSIGDGVITTDPYGVLTWMNPVAEQLTGWRADEAISKPVSEILDMVNEHTRIPVGNPVEACLREKRVMGLATQTILTSRQGTEYAIADSAAPMLSEKGQLMGAVMVFRDVTEERRVGNEMSYRAKHDALTGLCNRAEFDVQLGRFIAENRAEYNDSHHALMFIDLDQFKIVNDTSGHAAGDLLLKQISKLLRQKIRDSDFLARLGGDEFAIILSGCDEMRATAIAQTICQAVDDHRFVHGDGTYRIGASIGLVPMTGQWRNRTELMQAADTACYAAKEAGRNRVQVWADTDQTIQLRTREKGWATRIEQAIDNKEFVLFAQKISPLTVPDNRLYIEVLLRLPDGESGWITPGAFLPVAERYSMASRIDYHVVKNVIARLEAHPNLGSIARVNVNLSGQSVGDRQFHEKLQELLDKVDHAILDKLCFEITETVAIRSVADASIFVDNMHSIGIRISLDDFGAGSSSFSYLKNLEVDQLKIDGQFVRDVLVDPMDEVAVKAFVEIAKIRELDTVAEHVESAEVLNRMAELAVDYAQGFFLHKPEPLDKLLN